MNAEIPPGLTSSQLAVLDALHERDPELPWSAEDLCPPMKSIESAERVLKQLIKLRLVHFATLESIAVTDDEFYEYEFALTNRGRVVARAIHSARDAEAEAILNRPVPKPTRHHRSRRTVAIFKLAKLILLIVAVAWIYHACAAPGTSSVAPTTNPSIIHRPPSNPPIERTSR